MLRLLEHYPSIQGEGPRTGIPTQFVRFAGCNLRCGGWPCDLDTPYSIEPRLYRKEQVLIDAQDLLDKIAGMAGDTGARNICFTGGEPMLQPGLDLTNVIRELYGNQYDIEMFSNGTIEYSLMIASYCQIRMDWKLPGSGENPYDDKRIFNYYKMRAWTHHTIKFTIKDRKDFDTAVELYNRYEMKYWPGTIYAGPVWEGDLSAANIVSLIMDCQLPWRLNYQLHKAIWPADARRT